MTPAEQGQDARLERCSLQRVESLEMALATCQLDRRNALSRERALVEALTELLQAAEEMLDEDWIGTKGPVTGAEPYVEAIRQARAALDRSGKAAR